MEVKYWYEDKNNEGVLEYMTPKRSESMNALFNRKYVRVSQGELHHIKHELEDKLNIVNTAIEYTEAE